MGQRPRPWFERSGRAARFAQDPSGPQALRGIIDHVLITGTATGFVGDTAQLTATAYDVRGNVVTGVQVIWSSSQPAWISVVAGLCTFLSPGSATITATVDGRAYTTTATSAAPLNATLDWNPFLRPFDLAAPLTLVSNTGNTGYQDGIPQHIGSGILGLARASYPKSADEWGFVAAVDGPMSQDFVPNLHAFATGVQIVGPYPNTAAFSVLPNSAANHYAALDDRWQPLATADNQDATTFKRSLACALIARTPADVGQVVRVNLLDNSHFPGGDWTGANVVAFQDVTLHHSLSEVNGTSATAALWEHVAITFPDSTTQTANPNPQLFISMTNPAQIVGYAVAPYQARAWQAEGSDVQNWLRPLPFHSTLGVLSSDIYCNAWSEDSDLPTLLGGAVRASTAIAAPDSNRYFNGRTLSQYTLGVGDGITTTALIRIEDGGDTPPTITNTPATSAWVHWYVEPASGRTLPLNTDLAAYLVATGLVTVDEDTVARADNLASPGSMDTGQAWSVITGTWIVTGNRLQLLNNVGDATMVVDSTHADVTVDATVATASNDCAVVFRQTSGSNYWRLLWEAGSAFLQKNVAGGLTTVASVALTLANGDRLGVVLSGNSITPTKNGTTIAALVSTDAFNATATKHGLGASNTTTQFSHFKASISSANAHTYGPVTLTRDGTRYGSALVRANGGQFFRARFNVNQASEGYLDFTPKIVNASSGQLVFNAYRAAVTTEGARGLGLHSAWVPKRTITGRQFGDSAFEVIPNIQKIMTTPTLLWIMRQVLPWSFGDLENLNGAGASGYHPSLWQSGPYGTADYTFNCDVQPFYDGTFTIDITVARGSPTANPGSFMSWQIFLNHMSIAQAAAAWPKMVAFDIAVAALNGIPQALGIGLGTGTSVQWLKNGDTFLGGTVAYFNTVGTAWNFDGAGFNDSGHMGITADLDRVRQTNGFFRAITASNTVNASTFKGSAEAQISKWGTRPDFR